MIVDIYNQANLNKFEKPLELLKKIANDSIVYYKHAAALLYNDTIYSYGINKFIKEIKIDNQIYYKTMHAEITVFEKLPKKKVRGMDILVIRVNKNLTLKNSRPCSQCIDKLSKLGIRKVFYSNEEGDIVWEFVEQMKKTHISAGTRHLFCLKIN